MNGISLYFRYAAVSIRSQMQYRASFVMSTTGHFLTTVIEILGIWALFSRFRSLDGWTLPEIALLYGMVNIAFAVSEAAARGFDIFPGIVKSGEFDQILLRPRGTAFQVMARELQLLRIGRFTQGIIVLVWAAPALEISWDPARVLLLLYAVIGGACLFFGFFILQATLAFWTTESLEVMNILTYGGTETAQYPLAIYSGWFRKFFTFIIPLGCINYFPGLAIMGRADPLGSPAWFQWSSPVIGVLFLIVCLQVWNFGVRHYRSTGS